MHLHIQAKYLLEIRDEREEERRPAPETQQDHGLTDSIMRL